MKRTLSTNAIAVSVLLLTLLLVSTSSAQVQNSSNSNSIAGTWTGMWSSTQGGPKFVLMSQFNSDGNFNASETDEFAVTQGVWQRVDPRTFALTAYQFDFPALGQPYDGVFKVNAISSCRRMANRSPATATSSSATPTEFCYSPTTPS